MSESTTTNGDGASGNVHSSSQGDDGGRWVSHRATLFGPSVIVEISRLAQQRGAVNLAEGGTPERMAFAIAVWLVMAFGWMDGCMDGWMVLCPLWWLRSMQCHKLPPSLPPSLSGFPDHPSSLPVKQSAADAIMQDKNQYTYAFHE